MILTALSYAMLARQFPVSGSAYSYATYTLGPYCGFLAGWLIILDYILIPSLACILAVVPPAGSVAAWRQLLRPARVRRGRHRAEPEKD